jgi:hypothetical protein
MTPQLGSITLTNFRSIRLGLLESQSNSDQRIFLEEADSTARK